MPFLHGSSSAANRTNSLQQLVVFALLVVFLPFTVLAQSSDDSSDDGGDGSQSGTQAGADGTDTSSFSLSTGGLVAIIVVVVLVIIVGITSTILYVLAKQRQWEVRKSIKRASRRVTNRLDTARRNRHSRRSGVRMVSPSGAGASRGGKSDARARDLEKGQTGASTEKNKVTMSAFDVDTPIVRSWKDKVFGYKARK